MHSNQNFFNSFFFSYLKLKDSKSTVLKTLGLKYINFCKVILFIFELLFTGK